MNTMQRCKKDWGYNMKVTLIAKPLITLEKERKITVKEQDGKVYLMITPKRFIGCGETIHDAVFDANMRTFATGYRVEEEV